MGQTEIWKALALQGVPLGYVDVLRRLYAGQTSEIETDRMSKKFHIERGTRLGDPISPILYNACLEKLMRVVMAKWYDKKYGIDVGGTEMMTNLKFADYLLLVGGSLHQVKMMLGDLMAETRKTDLKVHPGKTNVLWNGIGRNTQDK